MRIEMHDLTEVGVDCWEAQIELDAATYYVIADVGTDIIVKVVVGDGLQTIGTYPWITSDVEGAIMAAVVAAHIEDTP